VCAHQMCRHDEKTDSEILGLSTLPTTTVPEIGNTVNELKKAGLRDNVEIIAAVNQEVTKNYGVDAWGKTAVDG